MDACADFLKKLYYRVGDFFVAEKDRLSLWCPVFFGSGIAFYFSLKSEPDFFLSATGTLCSLFFLYDCRRNAAAKIFALFVFLFAAGFFTSLIRSYAVSAPVVKMRTPQLNVTGTVESVFISPEKRPQLILKNVTVSEWDNWKTPEKIRITLTDGKKIPGIGDQISLSAALSPPMQPVTPYSFDMPRSLYFSKIGAIGSVQSEITIVKSAPKIPLREKIRKYIESVFSPDTAGIAKALILGESKSIPENTVQNFRDSGLAHILSVSGLHMGLIAGFIFMIVRIGLALIPAIALRFNTRKIAAIIAVFCAFGYLILAGSPISAQRAFIMFAFAMIAILFDRRAISLNSVAWAAFFILAVSPESLLFPGFQMSFGAVVGLVCVCETGVDKYIKMRAAGKGFFLFFAASLLGLMLTSAVATVASLPFTMYHFKRVPLYTLGANLFGTTVAGFVIMPFLLGGIALMPLGWDAPFFFVAEKGIRALSAVAAFTANLPHSVYQFSPMPVWGMTMATLGGLWLCLWKTKPRLFGIVFFAIGLMSPLFWTAPDILVSENVGAYKNADGLYVFNKAQSGMLTRKIWMEENKQNQELSFIPENGLLLIEKKGKRIAYARSKKGAEKACLRQDVNLLITGVQADPCPTTPEITYADLRKKGAHAVFISPESIVVRSIADEKGFRPWMISYPTLEFSKEMRRRLSLTQNDFTAEILLD